MGRGGGEEKLTFAHGSCESGVVEFHGVDFEDVHEELWGVS